MSDLMTEAPPAADSSEPKPTTGGGIKETIESILVAFILAFVFRAFVVEAFVIPTGSMSTTLMGAHTRYHCPDCGYVFDLNYSPATSSDDDEINVPSTAGKITTDIYCPNCGLKVPDDQTANPAVAYGDRILVLKYIYQISHPKRWDVVVFKAPTQPNQNYIKRLTGLPGESVMVLDGDVYIGAANEKDPKNFVVQAKTAVAQSAMWRLVYDNDYHPQGVRDGTGEIDQAVRGAFPWKQPWRIDYGMPGVRQDEAHGRVFTFDVEHGSARLSYDVRANPSAQGLSDYLVANQNTYIGTRDSLGNLGSRRGIDPRSPSPGNDVSEKDFAVSDLDVRLTYQRSSGAGPFRVAMTKRGHTFIVQLTPATATLFHEVDGVPTPVGSPWPLPAGDRPVRVELSNADYHAVLRIDDAVVAETTPNEYHPDIGALVREYDADLLPPSPMVTIQADGQQARVSHLSLWRDVYYYNRNPLSQPERATPDKPAYLGADEYFTMGDNSQLSYDARCWPTGPTLPGEGLDVQPGRVPGRFMLGRAFYVYWPAGYKANDWLPSFVPNFAGMRLIR